VEPDTPDEPEPPPAPDSCSLVPEYDVRNCIVCGHPMEGKKCKYVCRRCGVMVDCSDAF
jgi:hypothetical protein